MHLMRVKICFACSYSFLPTSVLPPSSGRATWPEMKMRSPARMQFDHSPVPASATLDTATLVLGMERPPCVRYEERPGSGGSAAAQTGPLQHPREPLRVEVGVGAVKQAAVVPHQQVARRPLVAVDET